MRKRTLAGALAGVGLGLFAGGNAWAESTYNIASIADFTGPYADIMKDMVGARHAVVDWWNDQVGKGLGVRVVIKDYDGRYDAAQIASLWPGIKAELNPIVTLGTGGPDVAALQGRLPTDKVPMIMATAGYGFAWKPDPWIFNPRPTYGHEAGAFYEWFRNARKVTAPLKVAIISSEASPAYVDIHKGADKYAKDHPDKAEIVEIIYTEVQPTDLTTQVQRVLRKGAQLIHIQTNTAAVVATKRALQALGRTDVPIMMSSHNGLIASGKAIGGLKELEGDFEVYGMAVPTEGKTAPHDFEQMLVSKYKAQINWTVATVMGLNQTMVALRAIEATAKKNGADKVTGEAVRNTMLSTPITSEQTFGILPNLTYTNEAPFPLSGLTVNIATVKDGKYTIVADKAPVPTIGKW
ncbi:MAG: ABC transporter substrate-binding protein [Bradyrhizobium sp.]|uniref:ABC transporter substrate-binding protein n=1 Tax=Bradyrhizobium sp. TaxID=376 RepID=UPI0025B94EF6|nr:ABC transporter substrate-binding protein [Bradyrhizobium sp.]MBI5261841.1 ABC transporter substrate-binding protein [Bradyrhizobium sp.]